MASMHEYAEGLTDPNPREVYTAETRNMNTVDVALRRYGFKIHSRPRVGPPIWVRDGKTFTQSEAEKEVRLKTDRGIPTRSWIIRCAIGISVD